MTSYESILIALHPLSAARGRQVARAVVGCPTCKSPAILVYGEGKNRMPDMLALCPECKIARSVTQKYGED